MLRIVEFPDDSKIKTIDDCAFSFSNIEEIIFPSKDIELKEEWCQGTYKLNKITISPDNPYFQFYDNKLLIKKSTNEQENYYNLVFCSRNVKNITIPNFIEQICPYSFNGGFKLHQVDFHNDSRLKTIDYYAFLNSLNNIIKIPPQLLTMGQVSFSFCFCLRRIV